MLEDIRNGSDFLSHVRKRSPSFLLGIDFGFCGRWVLFFAKGCFVIGGSKDVVNNFGFLLFAVWVVK
jgi:hypothetical protein